MKMDLVKKPLAAAVTAAILGAGAIGAQAYEQGDIILRAGIATVVPNTSSDPIELPDPVGTLPNGVDVDNGTAVSLIAAWMINDKWGLELLAATPFEHDIDLKDAPLPAGSTKHLPPTLSLQWYPRGGMDGWQPYLGFGVNYTLFFDEEVDPALAGFLVDNLPELGIESANLSLKESFGLAVQAGVDIPLNEKWAINAGIWYIDIGTEADVTLGLEGGGSATVGFDVDIDPMVYNIGFSYKF
jgi:outer membrane protein